MLKKVLIIGGVVLVVLVLYETIFINTKGKSPETAPEKESKEEALKPQQWEDVAKQSCEHNKPIIECAECRYEVGVVKIDRSLIKDASHQTGLIEITSVKKERPFIAVEVVGEIQPDPNKIIHIRSRTAGVVTALKTDLGQAVSSGQVIFEIDSNEYRELHLEFFRLAGLLSIARKNYEREERLYTQKLTTEKDYLEAQSEVSRLKVEQDTILRKLALLGLTSDEIKDLPNHTEPQEPCFLPVRTPLGGTVIERQITRGEFVESNAYLVTVADLSAVQVWANLYEKDLGLVQDSLKDDGSPESRFGGTNSGIKVEVSIAAYPDKTFSGAIDYISDQMDEHTRIVKARIRLDNPGGFLKIGMFAHCKLSVPINDPVLLIPQDALLKDDGKYFVFRQVGEDLFFRQAVKTGRLFAGTVEITEGLGEDNAVVSNGAFMLKSDILKEKMGAGCAD
ncbi:MAG: efflux RND transporter periplasmic adaptor subunit [Planctomycetota bacterium]